MDDAQAHGLNSAIRALTMRHRARAAELLAQLGLHPGQEFVLMALAANGAQTQSELADEIGCAPPSVTLMIRKLEAAGHVARRPSTTDRRATIAELTPQGRDLIEQLQEVWRTLAEETVAGTTNQPVDEITATLRDLAGNLRPSEGAVTLQPAGATKRDRDDASTH